MRWRGEQLHHTGPFWLTHSLTYSPAASYIAVASLHSSLLTSHSPHSAQVSSVQSRSSMKPGVKDIKAMERQKKELQAQLAGVRNKTQQLNKIIASKGKDPASSLHRTARPMEATALVVANKTLNDLRPIQRKHHVDKIAASAKAGPRDINDIEPMTFPLDGDLKRIQNQHIQRTKCKVAVEKLQKANAQKIEKKKQLGAMNHTHAPVAASMFPNRYVRGELPCTIEHGTKGQYLSWVCPLENLDYDYYLPIFFDGLQCDKEPVVFLATQGIEDMLYACQGDSSRVIPSLKNLVRPLRNALSKFNVKVLLNVLKALRQLVQCADGIGQAMTPYYKQFLQPMNTFLDRNKNIGDTIDYGQRNNDDIGEEVRLTLEVMERTGTENAFKYIKFAIPPYQSYKEGL